MLKKTRLFTWKNHGNVQRPRVGAAADTAVAARVAAGGSVATWVFIAGLTMKIGI